MLRKAVPADYPAILEIWELSVKATHDFLPGEYFQEIKTVLPGLLPVLDIILYEQENRPLAFLGRSGTKIEMLFVHPADMGKGIGVELMDFAMTKFGCTEVDVNEQNPRAVAFYQKMGFQVARRSEKDGMGRAFPILHLSR